MPIKKDATALPPAQLRLLGGFSLCDGLGRPLHLPYDKAKLLLALLALEPASHPRGQLAELLWPASKPAQARANLRRALFDLKRLLAPICAPGLEAVLADKKQLRLNPALDWQIDTRQLSAVLPALAAPAPMPTTALRRRLESGLGAYRGPLLDGLCWPDAPELEARLAPQRAALQALALQGLQLLADWQEQAGQTAAALASTQRALVLAPWNETEVRRCMRLLAQQDTAAALLHFERHRQALARDLRLQPEEETLALARRLRDGASPRGDAGNPLAERRRVVALACELEGSPHADPDPELLARQLPPRLAQAQAWLQRRGAHVQRADGGELLAFFGHPTALEQAPRRALDAALALRERLRADAPELTLRLGLHAGWVHQAAAQSGPDSAGGLSRGARRLALSAGPGEIRISAELLALDRARLRVAGQADGSALLVGAGSVAAPTMVGREAELEQLMSQWQQARNSLRAVLVSGEPGLGKTRLLEALATGLQALGLRVVRLACQPELQHSPYQPFIDGLPQVLGSAGANAVQPVRDGEPNPDPGARKREDEARLCALYQGAHPGQPQLLVLEDLHWADPSSLDLLTRYLAQPRRPGLIVLSSRDPAPPALQARLDLTLALAPLPPSAMARLLGRLELKGSDQAGEVLRRADGVPLYALELARALRDNPGETIPGSLWDLLAARLDHAGPAAKQLAQAAAVIGADFERELLQAVHGAPPAATQLQLERLVETGLLSPPDAASDRPRWRFRHALMRDAAYESMVQARRRELHRRLADALLGPFATLAAERPELLARQLSAAGDGLAAHYWLMAGRRAAARSAHAEASHHFEQGLLAPAGQADLELPLRLALGNSRLSLQGYGSIAARQSFERALVLADAPDCAAARFQALWGLWLGSRSGRDDEPPLASAQKLVDEAQRQGDAAAATQAAYALGNNHFFAGHLSPADHWLRAAAARARDQHAAPLAQRFGEHGGITAQAMLGWVLALQGRAGEAVAAAEAAAAAASDLCHAQTQAYTLAMLAVLHRHLRQPEPAARHALELRAFAQAHELLLWQAVADVVLGWAQAVRGDAAGLVPIRAAVAASAQAMPSTEATFIAFLIDALVALGRTNEALPWIADAMDKAQRRHEGYLLAELWRARAVAGAAGNAPATATAAAFDQALAAAQRMSAGLLALRSATARLRWLRGLGEQASAERLAAARQALDEQLAALPASPGLPDWQDAAAALGAPANEGV